MTASEVTRDMALYVTEAFYAYEAVRDARDEALTRCQELEDERDRAIRWAVALEQQLAAVTARCVKAENADLTRPATWRRTLTEIRALSDGAL